jgi:hypothetical protein
MILLQILEFVLGSIETWPATIIKHLFVEEPTLSNIKTLAAFFYGNGIPFYIAHYFYSLRNNRISDQASNIMRTYYVLWHCLKYRSHLGVYYNNTTFQKLMWINGRALDQMEYVLPHVSRVPLGIDGTSHSYEIISYKGYRVGISVLRCYYRSNKMREHYRFLFLQIMIINMSLLISIHF